MASPKAFTPNEPVAELASERNFQLSSEKNEERGGIFRLNLLTTDEFFAAERWKLQLKPIRQQAHNQGFTVLEMLIVISIMSVIIALGLAMSMDSWRGFSFRNDRDAVIAALQKARAQAINNVCLGTCTDGKSHGVYFDDTNKRVVVFQGNTYNASDTTNEAIDFESKATRVVSAPAGNEVVFTQLSGDLIGGGTAMVKIDNSAGRESNIAINAQGRIDY